MNENTLLPQGMQPWIQHWEIGVGALITVTLVMVGLALAKKVAFYRDDNDLGFSPGTFGIPLAMVGIFYYLGFINDYSKVLVAAVAAGLIGKMIWTTWKSNPGKPILSVLMAFAKLTLSFLYILYFYQMLAGEKRQQRGTAMFVIAIITPLLLSLVHAQEGAFQLSASGRPSFKR